MDLRRAAAVDVTGRRGPRDDRDSAGRGVLAVARPPLVLCGRSEEEHLGIPRPRAYRRVRADEEDRARADRVDEITIESDVALAAAVVDHLPRGSP